MQDYNSNEFKIRFIGELNEIDVNVLISSLLHTTNIIQEINKELNTDRKIEIKIKALDGGSFSIYIELLESIVQYIGNIFTSGENVAGNLIKILVEILGLRKFLKGRKYKKAEKEGNIVKIENLNGNIIVVKNSTFNIYDKNQPIKDAIAKNFETLHGDPSITGFEITDTNEKPMINIERKDFEDMSIKDETTEEKRNILEKATLNIIKLSFEGKYKWEFYYRGNKISANILDEPFNNLIDGGEKFAKGDKLKVDLEITQIFDSSANTFINKSYQIKHVVKHIPRKEQTRLDFSKDTHHEN